MESDLIPSPGEFPELAQRVRKSGAVVRAAVALLLIATAYLLLRERVIPLLLRLFPESGLTLGQTLALIAGGPVVLWVLVLVHESGHVLGGRMAGFRFVLMAAGPLAYRAGEGLELNRDLSAFAGYAVSVPDDADDLARRMRRVVIAGPLASLGAGALAILATLVIPVSGGPDAVARALTGLFGVSSVLVGMATMIPQRSGGLLNDGARFRQLLRPESSKARRDVALLTLSALEAGGSGPSTWDDALILQASEPADGSPFHFHALVFAARRAAAVGRPCAPLVREALAVAAGLAVPVRGHAAAMAAECARSKGQESIARQWQALVERDHA